MNGLGTQRVGRKFADCFSNGKDWVQKDLNLQPRDYESPALTVELWTRPRQAPSSTASGRNSTSSFATFSTLRGKCRNSPQPLKATWLNQHRNKLVCLLQLLTTLTSTIGRHSPLPRCFSILIPTFLGMWEGPAIPLHHHPQSLNSFRAPPPSSFLHSWECRSVFHVASSPPLDPCHQSLKTTLRLAKTGLTSFHRIVRLND